MFPKLWKNRNADASVIGSVIALLVAIIIGVMVWYRINTSMFGAARAPAGVATLGMNNTWAAVNTSANTVWTLFPIVAIVVIAGIILAIVSNFGRGNA